MKKSERKGSDGKMKSCTFKILGKVWTIALSETKWRDEDKKKKSPIWFSTIDGGIPTVFIWKLAIGFDNRK